MTIHGSGEYRHDLPTVPRRMRHLPIRRGYPVPWFVAMVNGDYHFPTADGAKLFDAVQFGKCWVCGQTLGAYKSFVVGPMCAVNLTTSEPACHHECAVFSAKACPFLSRPHMKRVKEHPDGSTAPPGMHIERNPGCCAVWTTRDYRAHQVGNGYLFRIGKPTGVLWFAEGRSATREEVQNALSSGLPILHDIAKQEGAKALLDLDRAYTDALRLMPCP